MTRDEIIDALGEVMLAETVAKAVCHDGFDQFVDWVKDQDLFKPRSIKIAWEAFRQGWDEK